MTPDEWSRLLYLLYKASKSSLLAGGEKAAAIDAFNAISEAMIENSDMSIHAVVDASNDLL